PRRRSVPRDSGEAGRDGERGRTCQPHPPLTACRTRSQRKTPKGEKEQNAMTTGAAAETTPKERGERRSSRVSTTLTALPDLLGDPIETEEQPRPGRRDDDARAADLEEDRQTGGTAEPEEGGKAETGDNGSEKQPGAATKPKRRRRKTQ